MIIIEESEMKFGPFEEKDIFLLEQELESLSWGGNYKKVEFILLKDNNLIFLEAKTSIPRKREDFFREIKEKIEDSINIFISALIQKNELFHKISEEIRNKSKSTNWKIYLIFKSEIPKDHLGAIRDEFRSSLNSKNLNIFGITDGHIIVMNEQDAIKYKLIQN